jgi:glycosyltransferase involved in cell wall biosynthesis
MRILFVSHQASRTGAPLLLLWLVQWLRSHTTHQLGVVLLAEGPLEEDFSRLCPTWTLPAEPLFKPLSQRLGDTLRRRRRKDPSTFLQESIAAFKPDVVYLNTLVLGRYLAKFQPGINQRPVFISHVHELAITLNTMSDHKAVAHQIKLSSTIISCAQVVQDNLTASHDIDPNTSLQVVLEYIPYDQPDQLIAAANPERGAQDWLQRIQAAAREGRFIFGSTGQAISRKGFDLLPQLIQACDQTFADRKFLGVWIGAPDQNELCQFIKRDLALLGLEDQVLIIPPVASALALINQMQAFILLSREDPHPLVVLEAASLGIPTVCFEASGGIGEFVMDGRGLSVGYLDLQAMARSLYALSKDTQLRGDLGARARERVFQAHTLQQAAERILAIIETTASRR